MSPTSPNDSLCLEFANTCGDRPIASSEELHEYADLVAWAGRENALSRAHAAALDKAAKARPGDAEAAFRRALGLRETVYRLFSATARAEPPGKGDLAAINRLLAATRLQLRALGGEDAPCFALEWTGAGDPLDGILWPVVRSAASLLTSPEAGRVRECASDACSWLFIDRSHSGRRRWCDMRTCGNRAKAQRYYRRHRDNG